MIWRRFPVALIGVLLFAGAYGPLPVHAQTGTPLQLSVSLNGQPTGLIGEFVQRDGALFVRPEEWGELGLRALAPTGADGLMSLAALTALEWRLDTATQTLHLTAPPALLQQQRLTPPVLRASTAQVESGTGVTANYDLSARLNNRRVTAGGLLDMRAFSPLGVLSSGFLAWASPQAAGTRNLLRLDTAFSFADPATMRRTVIGDTIGSGLKWSRPVRMAGLQIQSDFQTRPDLITFPMPSMGSTAAVPSTVDVLVNNAQVLSGQVRPGPFEVSQLPIVTGASLITTTITNALGQQVTTSLPFYGSTDMLAEGLESYSLELGWVRRNWGLVSNDYRMLAGAGTYRRGLSPLLTGEVHAEATRNLFMGGTGFTANFFNLGTIDLGVAGSVSGGRRGGQISFGANRLSQQLSLGFSAILSQGDFRDIAALNGSPVPRRLLTANASLALGTWGSFGIAYTGITRDAATPGFTLAGDPASGGFTSDDRITVSPDIATLVPSQRAELVSANYSIQLGRLSFYLTGFHDFAGNGGGGLLGLTLPLGPRSSASVSTGTTGNGAYGQFQAVQTPVTPGDWGYQAYAATNPDHQFLDVQYKSPWGLVTGGVDHLAGQTTLRAQAQGSLSLLEGAGVFASNTIYQSFAVVETGGVPGVSVLAENRLVGRTDAQGRILVPELRAFETNTLSINPNDVPITDTVGQAVRLVRPQDRSGVRIPFSITRSNAAIVKLTDAQGTPLPVGSAAILAATGETLPMGYEGALYAERLERTGNTLTVTRPDGQRCTVSFAYKASSDSIPTIGPLVCREL